MISATLGTVFFAFILGMIFGFTLSRISSDKTIVPKDGDWYVNDRRVKEDDEIRKIDLFARMFGRLNNTLPSMIKVWY